MFINQHTVCKRHDGCTTAAKTCAGKLILRNEGGVLRLLDHKALLAARTSLAPNHKLKAICNSNLHAKKVNIYNTIVQRTSQNPEHI